MLNPQTPASEIGEHLRQKPELAFEVAAALHRMGLTSPWELIPHYDRVTCRRAPSGEIVVAVFMDADAKVSWGRDPAGGQWPVRCGSVALAMEKADILLHEEARLVVGERFDLVTTLWRRNGEIWSRRQDNPHEDEDSPVATVCAGPEVNGMAIHSRVPSIKHHDIHDSVEEAKRQVDIALRKHGWLVVDRGPTRTIPA